MSEQLRFLLDEMLPRSIAGQLRMRGIDAISVQDVGRAGKGIPDHEQFAYAQTQRRAVVTRDPDYIPIAATYAEHFGVIMLLKEMSIGQVVGHLELVAGASTWSDVRNLVTHAFV